MGNKTKKNSPDMFHQNILYASFAPLIKLIFAGNTWRLV